MTGGELCECWSKEESCGMLHRNQARKHNWDDFLGIWTFHLRQSGGDEGAVRYRMIIITHYPELIVIDRDNEDVTGGLFIVKCDFLAVDCTTNIPGVISLAQNHATPRETTWSYISQHSTTAGTFETWIVPVSVKGMQKESLHYLAFWRNI